jgi:hypothetical protein
MNVRKRLRKKEGRKYGRACEWIGGILHFKDTQTPVPDVPHVPKPGREALGMAGCRPAPVTVYVRRSGLEDPDYHRRRTGRR